MEIFKEIEGCPGYFASNMGRIRLGDSKIINQRTTQRGYLTVRVKIDGSGVFRFVHRLVAIAFLGDVTGMEVDHLNFDKKDNRIENLEIVSREENMRRYHKSEHSNTAYDKISNSQKVRWETTEREPKGKKVYIKKLPHERKKRGPNPNAGRKSIPEEDRLVTGAISLSKFQWSELAKTGNTSFFVRNLLIENGFPVKKPTP